TLRFFIVLSIFLILKRSRFRYLAAAITSIIRYDGAALILAALVMDLIESKSWRQRLKPVLWSALALIPMSLWLWGTYQDHLRDNADNPNPDAQSITRIEYINHYDVRNRNVLQKYSHLMWLESIGSMLGTAEAGNQRTPFIFNSFGETTLTPDKTLVNPPAGDGIKIIMLICLLIGVGYGLHKKQWQILLILLFAVPYFFVHSLRYGTAPRHTLAITWVVLLLSIYGMQCLWKIIKKKSDVSRYFLLIYLPATFLCLALIWYKTAFISISSLWLILPAAGYGGLIFWKLKKTNLQMPTIAPLVLQAALILVAIGWIANLKPFLSDSSKSFSPQSATVPLAAMAAVVGVMIVYGIFFKTKGLFPKITLSALIFLLIISNQFTLTRQVGAGANDLEFKNLAQWYLDNAQTDEKLVCTLSHIVKLYAPRYKDNFVLTNHITGD
ncbi:MAG: hypothetical protein GY869_12720, partial [Planctomycetes bacterium]|nr:hypothetical protein [Planctomycetota bacterium]